MSATAHEPDPLDPAEYVTPRNCRAFRGLAIMTVAELSARSGVDVLRYGKFERGTLRLTRAEAARLLAALPALRTFADVLIAKRQPKARNGHGPAA
jgi:hypothetical protein